MIGKLTAALLLAALLLQAGCGFHLRGSSQIAPDLNPIHVLDEDLNDEQKRLVTRALQRSGAKLVSTADDSRQLRLVFSPLSQRRVAGSGLSNVAVVSLSMTLVYNVTDNNGQVLISDELRQTTELQLDTDNVLAHDNQKSQAKSDLEQALINTMLFQLTHL